MPQNQNPRAAERWTIPLMIVAFLLVFFVLVFSGGQCERYRQKSKRIELSKRYLDSVRREQQLHRLRQQR